MTALLVTLPGTIAGAAAGPPRHEHARAHHAHRLVVHWGDRTPLQGQRSVISGRLAVPGHGSGRPWSVALRARHGTWRPYLDTTPGPNGRFRFVVRLHRFNQPMKLRVLATRPGSRGREAGPRAHGPLHSGTAVFRALWRARPTRPVSYPGADVVWPAEQVLLGTDQAVSGHLTDPAPAGPGLGGTSVSLQQQVAGLWFEVSSSPVRRSAFRLPVPSDYLGHFTYRLVAGGPGREERELSEPQDVAVVPHYSPRGRADSHAFISPTVSGRWNPCEPITYRVNLDAARRGAMTDVRAALARVARATGLRFEYLGTTDVVPFATDGPFSPDVADLVIAWVDPHDTPGLFAPGVYGLGGPEMRSGAFDAAGRPVREIWQGGVVFTSRYNRYLDPGSGEGPTRVGALMHEIGHAVGLAHVDVDADDKGQIMYPSIGSGVDRWGAGDLAGLAELGAANGCVSAGVSPAPLPSAVQGGITAGPAGGPAGIRASVPTAAVVTAIERDRIGGRTGH